MEVCGIEINVRVMAELQRAVQEGLHLDVEPLADTAELGVGDAALTAQSGYELVDLAGEATGDIILHHHRP